MNIRTNWEDLRNAVVELAVDDYRKAYKKLNNPELTYEERVKAEKVYNETCRFFSSPHFSMFTELDGRFILREVTKRLEAEMSK